MPKTLKITDDVMRAVEQAAAEQRTTVDDFILSALKRALPLRLVTHPVSGLPVFDLPAEARPFTSDDVRRADEDA